MRKRPDPYQWVIDEYPPVITKDQLYKICHISKRTASHLLENGLIPCQCSGKKTRKYKIAIADVVEYLKRRDLTPNDYTAPPPPKIGMAVKLKRRTRKNRFASPRICSSNYWNMQLCI